MHRTLIGRDCEIEQAMGLLDAHKRVVLRGPAGIGKTHIATELAARGSRRSLFVRMDGAPFESALESLQVALVGEGGGSLGRAETLSVLAELGPLLIVLDHTESATDAILDLLNEARVEAPDVCFGITTRVARSLPCTMEIGPLSTRGRDSPAAMLFLSRATLAQSSSNGRALAESHVETVVELLGGHPLAIEMVAPRAALIGLERMATRLGTGWSELAPKSARLSMIERAITIAFEALSVEAAQALGRLAGAGGPVDRQLCPQLLEVPSWRSILDLLAERSMLVDDGQFVEVPIVARDFLRTHVHELANEGAERAARVLGSWCATELEHARRHHLGDFLERVARQRTAIEAACAVAERHGRAEEALALSIALARLSRRRHAARLSGLERALERAPHEGKGLRLVGHAHLAAAYQHQLVEQRTDALRHLDGVIALPLEPDLIDLIGEALLLRAVFLGSENRLTEAAREQERAAALFEEFGDGQGQARALSERAYVEYWRSNGDEALSRLEEAIRLHERAGDAIGEARSWFRIGLVQRDRGDLRNARHAFTRSLDLNARAHDPELFWLTRARLATVDLEEGAVEQATGELEAAFAEMTRRGRTYGRSPIAGDLARCLHRAGNTAAAVLQYREALVEGFFGTLGVEEVYRSLLAVAEATSGRLESAEMQLDVAERNVTDELRPAVEAARLIVRGIRNRTMGLTPSEGSTVWPDPEKVSLRARPHVRFALWLAASPMAASRRSIATDEVTQSADCDSLTISADMTRYRFGSKPWVTLTAGSAQHRVFTALVEGHVAGQQAVTWETLLARGWPTSDPAEHSSVAQRETARARVHQTIARLRKGGLGDALTFEKDGYRLPSSVVVRSDT